MRRNIENININIHVRNIIPAGPAAEQAGSLLLAGLRRLHEGREERPLSNSSEGEKKIFQLKIFP